MWLHGRSDFTPDVQSTGEVYPLVNPEIDKEVRPVVNVLSTKVVRDRRLGKNKLERLFPRHGWFQLKGC